MKTNYIIIGVTAFLFFFTSTKAQDTLLSNSAKIDSLLQLIDARPKADEEKVRLLNEYARLCFYNLEFQKGFTATSDAREISGKINFEGGQIMFYVTLAAFSGNNRLHYYQLRLAKKLIQESNNQLSEYYTELNVPIRYSENHSEQILEKLTPVLQYYENLDEKEIQLAIINRMVWSFHLQGRNNELKIKLNRVAELSRDLNQLYPEFIAYSRLKYIYGLEGNTEEFERLDNVLIEVLSKNGDANEVEYMNYMQANYYNNTGQYALSIDYFLKSADAFKANGNLDMLDEVYSDLGYVYETMEMQGKATEIYENYISFLRTTNDRSRLQIFYDRPVFPLYELKRYDEARNYMAMALQWANEQDKPLLQAKNNSLEGQILLDKGEYSQAIQYLNKTYETYSKSENNLTAIHTIPFTLLYLAECYQRIGDTKTALKYAMECLERENKLNHKRTIIKSKISFLISEIYIDMGKPEKAFDFIKMHKKIITESNKTENANSIAEAEIRSIIDKSEKQINLLEIERIQKIEESKNQRLWIFTITGALLSALLVSLILYRNNKGKQKTNIQLKRQKAKVEDTLKKLKTTQSQLIQSAKMASLGELTAGIAHEIQNPLNFVNNFSEVNSELIAELKEEIEKGDKEEAISIANNIEVNEQKINHHGKLATSIVRGMMQHSSTDSGQKEPTDINTLVDEYLRLSYHGFRAKDKYFNADFKLEADRFLPKINVVRQDLGRVLLNLINNAFQAVMEQANKNIEAYKPIVTVSTKLIESYKEVSTIEIRIKDNGPGIPPEIKDKIFQPFFTTKPTGIGTGLGLSLSYDIVKVHEGKLIVESIENNGAEFTIVLPIQSTK